MILGGAVVLFVRLIGDVVDGVGAITSHAPLDASAGDLAEKPGHVLLLVQVFLAVVDVGEAVDGFAREVGFGGAQIGVLRVIGVIKGQANGVDRGHLDLIIPVDLVPIVIDIPLHLLQPFEVLLFRSHACFLLIMICSF